MTQSISKMAEKYVATFWPEQPNKAVIQMAFEAGAISAEERHAEELQALAEKCYGDVKSLNMTWEESDKKIDAIHLKELQELKDRAVDCANITRGSMILDGYEPEDTCVKYMQELIEELKTLK